MKKLTLRNKYLQSALKDVAKYRKLLKYKKESFWMSRGKKMMEQLHKEMSANVPAYKEFLKRNNFTDKEIYLAPTIDKYNYLRANELKDLCWEGDLGKMSGTISSTSGSTGVPFYFPRTTEQDLMYSLTAELYMLENFKIEGKKVLYINAFAMGPWIGGVFTYEAINKLNERGRYNISTITTSLNKKDSVEAIKKFGKLYDKVIIGSYGPMLKDILDEGTAAGINWKEINIGFVFSAEGFSEDFRKYVYDQVGCTNYYTDSLNHYGTVDLGTMSYETPICILLRKLALTNKDFYKKLLRYEHKLPTLTQFVPEHFYFEEDEGRVICSSYAGLPLFRYDLKDSGGVVSFKKVDKLCQKYFNKTLQQLAKDYGIEDTLWQLPFVFVCERADLSVKFRGFEIYPETIKNAIIKDKNIYSFLTGKFTLLVSHDTNGESLLEINFELKRDRQIDEEISKKLTQIIVDTLLEENNSYSHAFPYNGHKMVPLIKFWEYENPTYFKSGGKQKWVKKQQ